MHLADDLELRCHHVDRDGDGDPEQDDRNREKADQTGSAGRFWGAPGSVVATAWVMRTSPGSSLGVDAIGGFLLADNAIDRYPAADLITVGLCHQARADGGKGGRQVTDHGSGTVIVCTLASGSK